jgi:hypothetical protein
LILDSLWDWERQSSVAYKPPVLSQEKTKCLFLLCSHTSALTLKTLWPMKQMGTSPHQLASNAAMADTSWWPLIQSSSDPVYLEVPSDPTGWEFSPQDCPTLQMPVSSPYLRF